MAADLCCFVLDTAAVLTELSLDIDHVTRLMVVNQTGVDEARHLEQIVGHLRTSRDQLQVLSRAMASLKSLPVTVPLVRER